jgi:hypothetical protein
MSKDTISSFKEMSEQNSIQTTNSVQKKSSTGGDPLRPQSSSSIVGVTTWVHIAIEVVVILIILGFLWWKISSVNSRVESLEGIVKTQHDIMEQQQQMIHMMGNRVGEKFPSSIPKTEMTTKLSDDEDIKTPEIAKPPKQHPKGPFGDMAASLLKGMAPVIVSSFVSDDSQSKKHPKSSSIVELESDDDMSEEIADELKQLEEEEMLKQEDTPSSDKEDSQKEDENQN